MQIKHLELLGKTARDKVTGFEGVIASICFDLYGCIQAILTPPVDKDGKKQEGCWLDINRLTIINDRPVMNVPDFSKGVIAEGGHGPTEKPISNNLL